MEHTYDTSYASKEDELRAAKIEKALVNLSGDKYQYYIAQSWRQNWDINDCYKYVGPIQYYGPLALTDMPPLNVLLKKTGDVAWNPKNDDQINEMIHKNGNKSKKK